ncbi:MAG: helix-turn-helix domain-containing protein [Acidobacteriota bacterium]
MARRREPRRLHNLVEAASRVFLSKGYRRTQVADVARAMGIASGTVYLYAESKEALFDLAVRSSLTPNLLDGDWDLPVKTPPVGSTFDFIKRSLETVARFPALESALRSALADPCQELETIVRELFRKTSARWLALKLLERCASDWPELAALWFGQHRLRLLRQLSRYLENRMSAGRLRKAPNPAAAARLILEMVAAFAMHSRTDPHLGAMDQTVAEDLVVDAVVHAYQPVETTRP